MNVYKLSTQNVINKYLMKYEQTGIPIVDVRILLIYELTRFLIKQDFWLTGTCSYSTWNNRKL